MPMYWVKTNRLVKTLFSRYVWELTNDKNVLYLTFDDGPVPEVTPWVLDLLKKYNAKATFFCIGKNVTANPEIFRRILAEGHSVGNHTNNHLNGWQTANSEYFENVRRFEDAAMSSAGFIPKLFRPPYGKITSSQASELIRRNYKIVMWDVLSADFDQTISKDKCLENVIRNVKPGSIVIFHDSVKAHKNLEYALPATLEYLKSKGYKSEGIS